MNACKCGCGTEIKEGAKFAVGHYAKWKSKNKLQLSGQPETISNNQNASTAAPYWALVFLFIIAGIIQYFLFINLLKMHWILLLVMYIIDLGVLIYLLYTIWRLRKLKEPVIIETLEQFLKQVPKWSIQESPPNKGIIGAILNKGKIYKGIVQVSKNYEPRITWAEFDGILFKLENRAFKPPNNVLGDYWFYDMDHHTPLIDREPDRELTESEDAEYINAVADEYYVLGHAYAMKNTIGKINLLILLIGACLISVIALAIYVYGQFDQTHKEIETAIGLIKEIGGKIK